MRYFAFLLLLISFTFTTLAQEKKSNFKTGSKIVPIKESGANDEQEEFQKAISEKDAATRISYLRQFVENFPESQQKMRALGLIVSGRAELADTMLKANDIAAGIELFKVAVQEAPTPISDALYRGIILQIPNNLFFRGQRIAGMDVAKLIEEKVATNPNQLLALSTFYLGIENAPAAIRVAEKVIELNPETRGVYQTLGLAQRFNFNLEKSAEAYTKAVEAEKGSISTKNSLAEMKRATGQSDVAITLYNEILAVEPTNISARTGLILSLFDAGKIDEAESGMNSFLEEQPNNLFLLVGAAYWYATKGSGDKAIDLSTKALAIEPRYTWGYIALARGLMKNGDPVEAEKVLLTARKYGDFPTLQYEIANARLAAGFYKDAADELKQSFVWKDGVLRTNLGGRFEVVADNFTDLLSLERRAGIFQTASADSIETAEKLKTLLKFSQKLEATVPVETEIVESADEFISGDDKMKTHRQIFVADQLLGKKVALSKVLEITKDATKGVDNALQTANPSAAVLANELYEARRLAMIKGEVLVVPNLPRQTLDAIIRGRIEEISGWALFKQENNAEASVRLKRAISVLPKDSVWMRSTFWRMGTIAEVDGNSEEALNYYLKGYSNEENSQVKMMVIESVYKKINGSLDGLKERIEAKPEEENNKPIFVKKDDSTVSKSEPKDSGKTDKKLDITKGFPNVVPIKQDDPAISNADKLPEDINFDISDEKDVQPTPELEESNSEPSPQIVGKVIDETVVKANAIDETLLNKDISKVEISDGNAVDNANPVETILDEVLKPTATTKEDVKTNKIEEKLEITKVGNPTVDTTPKVETDEPKVRKNLVIINDKLLDTILKIDPADKSDAEKLDVEKPFTQPTENETSKTADEAALEIPKKTDDETIIDESINLDLKKTIVDSVNTGNDSDGEKIEGVTIKLENEKILDESAKLDTESTDNTEIEKTIANTENAKLDLESTTGVQNNRPIDNKDVNANLMFTRPRIVVIENIKKDDKQILTCGINISQEDVSIINDGGTKDLVIGVEKESVNTEIKAVSSSPKDVIAVFDPEIGAAQRLAFFSIRSISKNTGDFTITFDTPCGKKEIPVKVR